MLQRYIDHPNIDYLHEIATWMNGLSISPYGCERDVEVTHDDGKARFVKAEVWHEMLRIDCDNLGLESTIILGEPDLRRAAFSRNFFCGTDMEGRHVVVRADVTENDYYPAKPRITRIAQAPNERQSHRTDEHSRAYEFWDGNIDRLKAFITMNGHADVPRRYDTDRKLATFVNEQRKRHKSNLMTPRQYESLIALGFSFDPKGDKWRLMLTKFENWISTRAPGEMPSKQMGGVDRTLYDWFRRQKEAIEAGTISPELFGKLEQSGLLAFL